MPDARLIEPNFFTSNAQLFPDWPIAPPNLIMPLLGGTLAMLLMPKVLASAWPCASTRTTTAAEPGW